MSRLLWMVAGLIGGIVFSRNAEAMPAPAVGACFLAMVAGCGVCWWAAYRGKSVAVATAVAVAVAKANADAEANAVAIAQAAVQLHLHQGAAALEPVMLAGSQSVATVSDAGRKEVGQASAADRPALADAPYSLWPQCVDER